MGGGGPQSTRGKGNWTILRNMTGKKYSGCKAPPRQSTKFNDHPGVSTYPGKSSWLIQLTGDSDIWERTQKNKQ